MDLKEIKITLDRYKSLYESALEDNAHISQANFTEVYKALDESVKILDIIKVHGEFAIIRR